MPCTPIAERASRTSSSLKGLMMAVTSFMNGFWWASELVERLHGEGRERLAERPAVGETRVARPVGAHLAAQLEVVRGEIGRGQRELAVLGAGHAEAQAVLVVEAL